ncbi:ATP-binding protein [Paenibacillus turpanensis]|uniref:ATP-binding protein n=1 Tax=Paenibacillus turpanensis TaxID=2689078 RepID=UPI0014078291|nr:ATP-binding protein [Paenibacillus turpanensis]
MLLLAFRLYIENTPSSSDAAPIHQWEYRYDDEPWQTIDAPRTPPGREERHHLWLRTTLPEGDWRDPSLVFQGYHKFEMYSESGTLLYSFGDMSESKIARYEGTPVRIISLSEDQLGQTVVFHLYSDERFIGTLNEPYIDSRSDIITYWLFKDTDQLVIGVFYMLFAVIAAYLYSIYRGQVYFLSFACFTFFLGVNTITRIHIIYLYYDKSRLWEWIELTSFFFGETFLLIFITHFFGRGWKGILRKLSLIHLAFSCFIPLFIAFDIIDMPMALMLYQLVIASSILIVLIQIWHYARIGSTEAKIVMAGTLVMCLFGGLDLLDSLLLGEWHIPVLNYFGLMFFITALAYVLYKRLVAIKSKLQHSEKLMMVGQLAAGIAHEIRNPLTVLSGYVSLLSKEAQLKGKMDILKSEVDRINRIVNEFLLLAKPSEPRFQPARIDTILSEIKLLYNAAAQDKGIEIELKAADSLPEIICDADQMKQVFMNLIKNAMEAMEGSGSITIEVNNAPHNRIHIRITDQGNGICEEELRKVGEAFYTTKEDGTGLGLMISQNIIEKHGGTLTLSSKLHVGTTVTIRLPVNPNQKR